MKKKWTIFLLSGIFVFSLLTACSSQENPNSADGKLTVCTSFYTMQDFTEKIGGDKIDVISLVPTGTEPHDWEPTPTDIRKLEEADVFVYNGADMEHWVESVLSSLQNENLVVVEASQGISLLEGTHTHEEEEEHEDHAETSYDPHVWLNPLNAKQEMKTIAAALAQADAENKDYYEDNYEKYAVQLDTLDAKFSSTLTLLPNKDIIVAHEAFAYLCDAYDLNQIGIDGLSPDSEPDAARMAEIIEFAKEHQVKVIFFEELVSPKVAESIAREVNATTDVLNPLEGLSDEQIEAGEDYFSIMEQNLEKLKEALA